MQEPKNSFFFLILATVISLTVGCGNQNLPEAKKTPDNSEIRQTVVSEPETKPSQGSNSSTQSSGITNSSLITYEVMPQSTDAKIDDWLESHYVAINPSVSPQKRLFLFFSGSYGQPSRQRLIVEEAANLGVHAINLHYPNSWSVGKLCRRTKDENCHEKVRLEILDGQDRSQLIEITSSNAIENRLVKLLGYLHQQNQDQGWLNYLDGDSIRWSSVIVAGHSQGGGQAAIIAKNYPVARVVMLAAPADYSRFLQAPAPWLTKPSATSPEKYYGFVHGQDPAARRIEKAWQLLEMSSEGKVIDVDTQYPPYNRSRQLLTTVTPARPDKFHGSVATDSSTPKSADGTPMFKDVWKYLIVGE